jgi:hypothetical protein
MPLLRALLLTCLLGAPASAQRWPDRISEGAHLRVQTRTDGEYEGSFRRPADDSLRIIGSRGFNSEPRPIAFSMTSVTKVDVRTGGSPLRRGLAGLALGGVAGGIVGALIGNSKECARYGTNKPGECFSYSSEVGMVTAIFAVVGVGAGALVGGVVGMATSGEGWKNLYIERGAQPSP